MAGHSHNNIASLIVRFKSHHLVLEALFGVLRGDALFNKGISFLGLDLGPLGGCLIFELLKVKVKLLFLLPLLRLVKNVLLGGSFFHVKPLLSLIHLALQVRQA